MNTFLFCAFPSERFQVSNANCSRVLWSLGHRCALSSCHTVSSRELPSVTVDKCLLCHPIVCLCILSFGKYLCGQQLYSGLITDLSLLFHTVLEVISLNNLK